MDKKPDLSLVEKFRERRRAYNRGGGRWYDIRNASGDVAEVRIYDEIGFFGITADDFVKELAAITAPQIHVAINSPGGDVFDGIAIYNALRNHPATVTTRVDSLAASAASLIVQAGEHRTMFDSSQMMIHEAWGVAIGNASEMREFADILEMQDEIIADIYASASGKEASIFRDLMAKETWLRAEEAVAQGLADEVVEPGASDSIAKRTLRDEIEDTMGVVSSTIDSVERVAALRAEKGKPLSDRNLEGLDGLKGALERMAALLTPESEPVDLAAYRRKVEAYSRSAIPVESYL